MSYNVFGGTLNLAQQLYDKYDTNNHNGWL